MYSGKIAVPPGGGGIVIKQYFKARIYSTGTVQTVSRLEFETDPDDGKPG
jgi:hypothetical protein